MAERRRRTTVEMVVWFRSQAKLLQLQRPPDPPPTVGHTMVVWKGSLIVWGGYNEFVEDRIFPVPGDLVYVFPAAVQTTFLCLPRTSRRFLNWFSKSVFKGDVPESASGACGLIWQLRFTIFGGYSLNRRRRYLNTVYMLNFEEEEWFLYSQPKGIVPTARDKMAGWVHRDRCYFFGGYGVMNTDDKYIGNFILDIEYGWNNQLLVFDPAGDGEWAVARVSGRVPKPRACSSAAYMEDRACTIIFGGRHRDLRLNDLYLLDMKSLIFTQITVSSPEKPVGRSWSTLNLIGPSSMVLFGGCGNEGTVLGDLWILEMFFIENEIDRVVWKRLSREVTALETVSYWHTAAVINGFLIVHGGSQVPPYQFVVPAIVRPRRVAPASLVTICLAQVNSHFQDSASDMLPLPLKNCLECMKIADLSRNPRSWISSNTLCSIIDSAYMNM